MMEFGFNFARFNRDRPQRPGGGQANGAAWARSDLATASPGQGLGLRHDRASQHPGGQRRRPDAGIIGLVNKGQPRKPDDWGALRAWAWGASRALDYLETDTAVDAKQVGITGLSRYGKAALVAMAYDPRFAIGFIGSSGAGGAKLHRRNFGEQVENLAGTGEYHWMAGNFLKYGGPLDAGDLPVDAHELIALCARGRCSSATAHRPVPAPRASGSTSAAASWPPWPPGRSTGCSARRTSAPTELPPVETALVDGELAWRQHSGGHTTGPNWPTFFTWADRYIKAPPTTDPPTIALPALAPRAQRRRTQPNPLFAPPTSTSGEEPRRAGSTSTSLGDSITRRWRATDYPDFLANWKENFHGWNAANFGWGGDTIQNVLWRLQQRRAGRRESEGHRRAWPAPTTSANVAIATMTTRRVDDIAGGIKRDSRRRAGRRHRGATIILMGITPRNDEGGRP